MRKLAPKTYKSMISEKDQDDLTTMVCNLHYFSITIVVTDGYVQLNIGLCSYIWDRKTEKLLERSKV